MKKFTILLAAFAAFAAVSCNKEIPVETPAPEVQDGFKTVTITANIEGQTKTSYDADGKFSWTKGDQISILASDNKYYTFTATETAAASTFTGVLPADVELGTYALYPADENHTYDVNEYYPFGVNIPSYLDLSNSNSANLPLHGESTDENTFTFKHMTGGFLFTFENIADSFTSIDVNITTASLKISGVFQARKSSTLAAYVTYATDETNNNDEKTFKRKVKVNDNKAQVYLPYSPGYGLWGDTTIEIVGYDNDDNATKLTTKELDLGDLNHSRAVIVPVTPLVFNNLENVDWEATNVATCAGVGLTELKAVADYGYLYIRIAASTTYAGDTFSYYIGKIEDGNEVSTTPEPWWGWTTQFTTGYTKEVTLYNETIKYNKDKANVVTTTNTIGETKYWNLAFPRNAHEVTTEAGTVYFGAYSQDSSVWQLVGYVPNQGSEMLKVTLP